MAKRTGKMLLCRRYAVALFDYTLEKSDAQKIAAELEALALLMQESRELDAAFSNPSLPVKDVAAAAEALLRKGNASEATIRFTRLLAENRRIHLLPGIVEVYRELLAERNNEITAEIASAVELKPQQVQQITDGLKKFTGRKVAVKKTVNPALLGGFTVKIGSRMLDGSLAGKLDRLAQHLKRAENA